MAKHKSKSNTAVATKPADEPVSKAAPKIFSEMGKTGLNQYGGVIYEEQLKQLKTQQQRQAIYKEMINYDPVVGAILFAIEMLIRQAPLEINCENEEYKEFLKECIDDMSSSWADTVSEILSFLGWGFSVHEIVYKYRQGYQKDPSKRSKHSDNRIGWRKLAGRGQDTLDYWEFDDEGGLSAFVQLAPPSYTRTTLPIEKMLLFRASTHKGNPEGRSVLDNAFTSYYYRKRIQTFEAIGIERDLAGLPVAYVPVEWTKDTATANEKAAYTAMKKLVTNIRRDEQEGIVFPLIYDENGNQMVKLELLTSGGKRNFDTDKIIQRYDQRIAMTVLADFILLGTKSVGSFALSSDKTELFSTAIGAWQQMVADVFNRHAIPRLFALNGFNMEELPTISFGDIEKPSFEEFSEMVNKLSGANIDLSDFETQNYIRTTMGLPELDENDYDSKMEEKSKLEAEKNALTEEKFRISEAVEETMKAIEKAVGG